MSYPAGAVFVTIATILLIVFSHKLFFGDGAAGLLDFSELYYWGQWAGFWCATLSLCFFVMAARGSPFSWLSRRGIPPALAVALCLSFLIFSIPEWSNKHAWRQGATGGRVYIETKIRRWRERQETSARVAIACVAFEGQWKSADGARLEIHAKRVVLTQAGQQTEFSAATCPEGEIRFVMTSRVGVGAHFYRAGLVMSPQYKSLPEGEYPLVTYACSGREAAFMAIAPRQLVAVFYDDTVMTFMK